MRHLPRLTAFLVCAILLVTSTAFGQEPPCDSCHVAIDLCGAGQPFYNDPAFTANFTVADRLVAGTGWGLSANDPVVRVFDLGPAVSRIIASNNNWLAPPYDGPAGGMWTQQNLGSVFGITFDTSGNIYVAHSAAYSVFGAPAVMADFVGPGGAGAVYKIANGTGAITLFSQLPNYNDTGLGGVDPADRYPGLGNITFNPVQGQFYVTNMEDGRIYRLNAAGAILSTYDPGASDPGPTNPSAPAPTTVAQGLGAAPLGERLWAVKWHDGRIYYGRWRSDLGNPTGQKNEIRSVGLDGAGDFIGWDDRLEVQLPFWAPNYSNPVSDIAFSSATSNGNTGNMLLAERSMSSVTTADAHMSRLLEYACVNFQWVAQPTSKFGGDIASVPHSCAGGCDYDRALFNTGGPDPYGRVWGTYDHMENVFSGTPWIYGLEAINPAGGHSATSYCIDFDGNTSFHDKQAIGDVAIPCPPGGGEPDLGSIGGMKFNDLNHNGIFDGADTGLSGWTISIMGPVNTTVTTGIGGSYVFPNLPPGTYTICEVTQPGWIVTLPANGCYTITIIAGQVVSNVDFGNYRCLDTPADSLCVDPPSCTIGWWPFDENAGAIANDVASNNDGSLNGAAAWLGGQYVNNSLSFPTAASFVNVLPVNTQLNISTKSVSMDAWINMVGDFSPMRAVIDRRQGSPGAEKGYLLGVLNNQLTLQFGTGGAPAVISGGPNVSDGQWHHVAATVCREPGQTQIATIYVDGVPVASGVVPAGSILMPMTIPLRFGQQCPGFTPQSAFSGYIDEPEIFNCCLNAGQIQALYSAKTKGKCRDLCYTPSITTVAQTATTATLKLTICNAAAYPQMFCWTAAGLPIGGPCTIAGPTVFTPLAGSLTVPAFTCTTLMVPATLPPGLTGTNKACYQFTVLNKTANTCCTAQGAIQRKLIIFDTPITLADVPESTFVNLGFAGVNEGPPIQLDYTIADMPTSGDPADANALRLNGLPPGEPVIGTLQVAPGPFNVPFDALFVDYQPFRIHEIVLSADSDGDGILEPVVAVGLKTTLPGGVSGVPEEAPPPPPPIVSTLSATPNPFESGTIVRLSLKDGGGTVIRVYDVGGRPVRLLHEGSLPAGDHDFAWDGRSDGGRVMPPGIYFVKVQSKAGNLSAKVIRVR